ncbi:MAG: hypothetical protein ABI992_09445 [Chthoniobacterales bacterium]
MTGAACLTLALIQGLIWLRQREAWANLLLLFTAVGTAAMAAGELAVMHSPSPAAFGTAMRWTYVAVWMIFLSLAGFVRFYLRAGRSWLAWTACALRTVSLVLNFSFGQNLNYLEIVRLRQIPFLGGSIAIAEGVPNPWMLVSQFSLLLLLIFVADATVNVWRRGNRRQRSWWGAVFCFLSQRGRCRRC